MNAITLLQSESFVPTTRSDTVLPQTDAAPEPISSTGCIVVDIQSLLSPAPPAPAKFTAISDLVKQWEQNPTRRAALENARKWVADTVLDEDGITLRTLRLRKGLSQAQLAEAISSTQPHIARIEQGKQSPLLPTCRKIKDALGIDMNTLDQALKHQEALTEAQAR